jgi:hypothetical protein
MNLDTVKTCVRGINDPLTFIVRFEGGKSSEFKADDLDDAKQWVRTFNQFFQCQGFDAPVRKVYDTGTLSMDDMELSFKADDNEGDWSGFLWKRAVKSGRNWKRRLFVLREATLIYCVDEGHCDKPKGAIKITRDSTVNPSGGDVDNAMVLQVSE